MTTVGGPTDGAVRTLPAGGVGLVIGGRGTLVPTGVAGGTVTGVARGTSGLDAPEAAQSILIGWLEEHRLFKVPARDVPACLTVRRPRRA